MQHWCGLLPRIAHASEGRAVSGSDRSAITTGKLNRYPLALLQQPTIFCWFFLPSLLFRYLPRRLMRRLCLIFAGGSACLAGPFLVDERRHLKKTGVAGKARDWVVVAVVVAHSETSRQWPRQQQQQQQQYKQLFVFGHMQMSQRWWT